MEEYIKHIEPLLIKIIATSYKITAQVPLSEADLKQMENIKKCADLFRELNKDSKDILFLDKKCENKNSDTDSDNTKLVLNNTDNEFAFDINLDNDFSLFVDENKNLINCNNNSTDTNSDSNKKENNKKEISYETDPELIEICKKNKILFDEFTKQNYVKLQNIQDSFWSTVDVK